MSRNERASRARRKLTRVLVGLSVGVLAASSVEGTGWRDWSASRYPARVKSVTFSHTLDTQHCVHWASPGGEGVAGANWEVCFSDRPPVATYECKPGSCPAVLIQPLSCRNAVAGTVSCLMVLSWLSDYQREACGVAGGFVGFQIRCPLALELE